MKPRLPPSISLPRASSVPSHIVKSPDKQTSLIESELADTCVVSFDHWDGIESDYISQSSFFVDSAPFSLGRYEWCLRIYPRGMFQDSDFVAVNLVNLSNKSVNVKYSITLKSKRKDLDITWSDPDGMMLFTASEQNQEKDSPNINDIDECLREDDFDNNNNNENEEISPAKNIGKKIIQYRRLDRHNVSKDNEWGHETFISWTKLNDPSLGYIRDNRVIFRVFVELYGVYVDIDAHPWTKDIFNAENESELETIAMQDLSQTIQKLTLGKQSYDEKRQDELIVTCKARLHPDQVPQSKLATTTTHYQSSFHDVMAQYSSYKAQMKSTVLSSSTRKNWRKKRAFS